jgi:phage tail-like protein
MTYPLPNYRYFVSFDSVEAYSAATAIEAIATLMIGAFASVSGLGGDLELLAQPEGGRNDFVHQLPIRRTWSRIVLKKGITIGSDLWEWFTASASGRRGARRDGAIVLMNADGLPTIGWEFRAGLAAKWVGPDLNAKEPAPAVETLEIAHEGLFQVSLGSIANSAVGGPL